jgi:TRAP-type C4-dicarboxylate transport system permease small subunit
MMVTKLPPSIALVCDIFGRVLVTIFLVVMTIQSINLLEIMSMRTSPTMGFNMVWVFIITPLTCILQLIFLALMTIEDVASSGPWTEKSLVLRPHNIDFE